MLIQTRGEGGGHSTSVEWLFSRTPAEEADEEEEGEEGGEEKEEQEEEQQQQEDEDIQRQSSSCHQYPPAGVSAEAEQRLHGGDLAPGADRWKISQSISEKRSSIFRLSKMGGGGWISVHPPLLPVRKIDDLNIPKSHHNGLAGPRCQY